MLDEDTARTFIHVMLVINNVGIVITINNFQCLCFCLKFRFFKAYAQQSLRILLVKMFRPTCV